MANPQMVWVFNGSRRRKPFNMPSGVFTSVQVAEAWIKSHSCSGVLSQYPVNISTFDWAMQEGHFVPAEPEHLSSTFIESFMTTGLPCYRYEDGRRIGDCEPDDWKDHGG